MFHWTIHLAGDHRKEHQQAAVAVGHRVYCFGGGRNQSRGDPVEVDVFNTVSLCWRTLTPGAGQPHLELPSRREGHTAVLIGHTVYLWGGWSNPGYCNVLYAFDVDTHRWSKPQVSGTVPGERTNHTACVSGKVMYIHGGYNRLTGPTNDLYKLDTTTMVWTLIDAKGTPPPASVCHSATVIGTKMFIFGGWDWDCHQYLNTIRVFDTETNHWLDTPSQQLCPEGRDDHSAFAYKGELYVYGGCNYKQTLNDVWKFRPETFTWKKVEPRGKGPAPTSRMCCCVTGDRVILFGGTKWILEDGTYRHTSSDDLYVLDFSPGLRTLCQLGVIQYGLEQSELPHHIRRELTAMTSGMTSHD